VPKINRRSVIKKQKAESKKLKACPYQSARFQWGLKSLGAPGGRLLAFCFQLSAYFLFLATDRGQHAGLSLNMHEL